MKVFFSNYRLFFNFIFISLTIFNLGRLILAFKYNMNFDYMFFIYAIRMDIIVIFTFLLIPILLHTLNFIKTARFLLAISLIIFIFLEITNYLFFEEFHTRLNYLFIEYLEYPIEIFKMIWESYKIVIVGTILFIYLFIKLYFKYTNKYITYSKIIYKLLFLPIIIIILALGIRSSLDSSTPNQSFYSYSNSVIKNDITNNTIFSLLYAIYLKSHDKMPFFGKLDKQIDDKSLLHHQSTQYSKKDKVVLVILESFGNSFVGSLNGTPTTPMFDKMAKDGLFLSNMYSSSNRSNRGIEAVLSSLFPVYGNTFLKLPKSQTHFWTIAKTMKKNGYKTVFLYGGDSKFDNMKGFILNNGFDEVVDQFNFDKNIKRYTWGVSDEELYKKGEEILNSSSKPIFLVIYTLSSHKPFDYPDNKIEYYKKYPIKSFANSIKYADYSLGNFYNKLINKNFFTNGVFAAVADHNAHITGNHIIPVNEFRIPALFIAKDLKAKEITNVTHQIDIAPTLLDISGIDCDIPAMGVDLTKISKSRALITHRSSFAYLKDDVFVLYQKNKKPTVYDKNYKVVDTNNTLVQEGLYYIYKTYDIYNKKLHKDNNEEY